MIDGPTIERPLLWRVVRRCSVPFALNLVLFALEPRLGLGPEASRLFAGLRLAIFYSPFAISAWTVTVWEDDRLTYGRAVLNAWLGTVIAMLGTAAVEFFIPILRGEKRAFVETIGTFALIMLPPVAVATAACRALLRRRLTAATD